MRSQQERVRLSRGLDGGHCLCIRYLRLCSDDRACNEVMESAAFLVEQDNDELAPGPNLNANKRPSEPRRRMRIKICRALHQVNAVILGVRDGS